MPVYKRKRSYGRRARRVKPRVGRRMFRSNRLAPRKAININKQPIRYSKEHTYNNFVVLSGASFACNSYTFNLQNQLSNYTEFTNLFDQYRLRTVIFKMRLIAAPEANNTPSTLQFYPDVYATVDHDDSSVPTTIDEIKQYGKSKSGILRPNRWFTYKCHPTVSMQIYRSTTTTGYGPVPNKQWIDLAYTDVPYYGVKVGVDCASLGTIASNLSVEVRAYCVWEFKNSR